MIYIYFFNMSYLPYYLPESIVTWVYTSVLFYLMKSVYQGHCRRHGRRTTRSFLKTFKEKPPETLKGVWRHEQLTSFNAFFFLVPPSLGVITMEHPFSSLPGLNIFLCYRNGLTVLLCHVLNPHLLSSLFPRFHDSPFIIIQTSFANCR